MDLTGKYEKSNLLGNGEVQVWRGRERARGTPVLLHTFTGSPRVLRLAVEYLLARPASSPLIEIGEMGDVTCLVTASELDMLDITAWLDGAVVASRNAPPSPAPPMPQRMETGPVQIPVAKPAPVQHVTQQPAQPPTQPPTQQPGEFTRAFQVPSASVPPPRPQDPMATTGPNKPSGKPGEFTSLFQTPAQAAQPSQSTKMPDFSMPPARPETQQPAAPAPAGEFTRLFRAQPMDSPRDFGSGSVSKQPPPPPSAPPKMNTATGPLPLPEQSAPPVPKGPGEYTRVMQAPSLQGSQTPQAPPAPQSPSPSLAQAVQLPSVSVTPPSLPSVQPPSLQAPQVQAPQLQTPYVQASVAAPQVSTPQIPTPQIPSMQIPAPSGKRPGISPVIFLLGGLVLVALVLVLIFALRR